jgi:Protein of unknown function (DUF3616)
VNHPGERLKRRLSLSGIACPAPPDGERPCIVAFDEGGAAGYARITGQRLAPGPVGIRLLQDGTELDAEAAASDGAFAYVTGSFSRKRTSCTSNPGSRHVFRLALGPDGFVASPPVDDQGRLWKLMSADATLGPFVDKCLGTPAHGINIEGIAVRKDKLYFGFREPARDKRAYILRVSATALFAGGDLAAKVFRFDSGKSSGIRDLLAVPEGLLVLIGPDDDSKAGIPWWIGFWDGTDSGGRITVRPLAELGLPPIDHSDCRKEFKPEAMTLLEDGGSFRRLLILSDGLCDGGPLAFKIPK